MARGYLGKISAIVTANTDDFSRRLSGAARDADKWANSVQRSFNTASTNARTAFDNIFTPLQKVQRALEGVQRINPQVNTRGVEALVLAAEQLAKPLSGAVKQFSQLGDGIQSSLSPALASLQSQLVGVRDAFVAGGSVGVSELTRLKAQVEDTAAAFSRLTEAQNLARRGPRGNELAFADPRVRDALNASADVRTRAAAAPASVLASGQVGRDVRELTRLDELITRARARVESRILLNLDTSNAESRLNSLIARQGQLRNSLESQIGGQNFVSRDDLASSASRTREQQAARALTDQQRLADNEIALLQRREQAAKAVEASRLSDQQRVTDNEIALLQRREQAAKEVEARRLADQQRAADNEIAIIQNRERAALEAERTRLANRPVPLGDSLRFGAESRARDRLGPRLDEPFGASQRGLSSLQSQITGVKSQLDALPNSFRSQFIPSIAAAEREFVRLSSGAIPATAGQIENASNDVRRLEADLARVSATSRLPTFNEFIDAASLRRATGELKALGNILNRIGAEAGGPAAAAFDRLRAYIQNASLAGTLNLPAVRREIVRLEQEAAQAAAAVGGIRAGAAFREIQRGGDVASGRFQNVGLAVQQAAFAFEDFFSVTGGLDQRIRAAGNNISQLGFILGGTAGLIAGIATVITTQLVVGLIKWYNAGVSTEDQVKSLNDSLSRQKSLVEGLADAFSSLARDIERISLSKPGQEAAQFARQIDDVRKKQRELAEERAAAVDPAVQRERGIIQARERELQAESNPGARVGLNIAIAQARRRERAAVEAAASRAPVTPEEAAAQTVQARRDREIGRLLRERSNPGGLDEQVNAIRQRFAAEQERVVGDVAGAGDRRQQIEAARRRVVQEQENIRAQEEFSRSRLQTLFFGDPLTDQRNQQLQALEQTLVSLTSAMSDATDELEIRVLESARAAAKDIESAQAEVARGVEAGVQGAVGLQSVLDGLGERLSAAVDSLAEARRRAQETRSPLDDAAATAAQQQVDEIRRSISQRQEEASAIGAATSALERFADALDRVAQQALQNLEQSQRRADEARLRDLGFSTPQSRDARARAERDLERQRQLEGQVAGATAAARARAQQDPVTADIERRIATIDAQLQSTGVLDAGVREALAEERARLQREADARVRQAIENDRAVQNARDASDREAQRQESVARGAELAFTPAQRAAEDLARQFNDISNFFRDQVDRGLMAPDAATLEAQDAQRRALRDSVRQTAPAMFALRDQVANAVLQGPSRAALQASDVSTMQGQTELNRLLRGDDAARNQDLVELQRQNNELTKQLVDLQRNAGIPPVLDL